MEYQRIKLMEPRMKDIKEVIQDIRSMLKSGAYENEQHIRISLVAYLCYSLKWNIWNPSEFYTEYSVDVSNHVTSGCDVKGKVDIALIKNPKKKSETLIALIETKTPGNIDQQARKQLRAYSEGLNHPLSILTDGRHWEFYLNSLPGPKSQYQQRMINEIDLLSDDVDDLSTLFENILNANTNTTKLTVLGKKMRKEFFIIQNIKSVKPQVENQHPGNIPAQLQAAMKAINTIHGHNVVKLDEVNKYWNTKMALGQPEVITDPGEPLGFSPGLLIKPLHDYTGMSIKEISIAGAKAFPVSNLAEMKKAVYNFLITKHPGFCTKQRGTRIQEGTDRLTLPLELIDGRYTEGSLSFNGAVDHCRRAMKEAGYKETDLIIGYISPKKK